MIYKRLKKRLEIVSEESGIFWQFGIETGMWADRGRHKENARRNDVVHCCRAVCRGWQAVCGLQAFQEVFQNNGCRNFAVGCFWNYERCGGFDNVIAHNHVAAHRQTVHEVCVIGYCHVF